MKYKKKDTLQYHMIYYNMLQNNKIELGMGISSKSASLMNSSIIKCSWLFEYLKFIAHLQK